MPFFLALLLSSQLQAGTVTLKIRWQYKDLPPGMELFEKRPEDTRALWDTRILAANEPRPYGRKIEGSNLTMQTGTKRMFYLVYRNTTKAPLAFFAAPHHVHPPELSLGFKFHCLCINHVYQVPPGYEWIRLVEIDLDRDFTPGELEITHLLAGRPAGAGRAP